MGKYTYKNHFLTLGVYVIDILIAAIGYIFKNKKISFYFNKSRAILINPGGIGDIVLMEPLIRLLKINFPGLKIDILIREEIKEIAYLIKGINEVIHFPLGMKPTLKGWILCFFPLLKRISKKYTLGFDIKGDPFSILLMTKARIPYRAGFINGGLGALLHYQLSLFNPMSKFLMNVKLAEQICHQSLDDSFPSLLDDILKDPKFQSLMPKTNKKVISVVMTAGEDSKLWPKNYWNNLLHLLRNQFSIIILGDKKIFIEDEGIKNMTGLPLLQSIAIVKNSDFFIGLDSGLSHISAGYRVPTFCIFSSSHDPKIWGPTPAIIKSFTPPDSLDLNPRDVYNEIIAYLDK